MRLAAFIRANTEAIANEWERFAATIMPQEEFSASVLRDDVVGLLSDIAANMDEEQTAAEQQAKSEGEPGRSHYARGAIVQHVVTRVSMGFSPRQFLSEFPDIHTPHLQKHYRRDAGRLSEACVSAERRR